MAGDRSAVTLPNLPEFAGTLRHSLHTGPGVGDRLAGGVAGSSPKGKRRTINPKEPR
jgi:hypothetical protein